MGRFEVEVVMVDRVKVQVGRFEVKVVVVVKVKVEVVGGENDGNRKGHFKV